MATENPSGTEYLGLQEPASSVEQPSGSQVQAQEAGASQNPFAGMTPEQIQQEIERRAQSMKDRELHRVRLQMEQEMAQRAQMEAQRREWEELDDEEYGRRMRQAQQEQAATGEQVRKALMGAFVQMQEDALSMVGSQKTRDALKARSDSGEFHSFAEFHAAIVDAAAQERLAKERANLEKQIRGAAVREATADNIPPILGSGIPTQSGADLSKLSSEQLIAYGWAAKIEAQRRSRGG
jgi:hypothetical protein